MQNNIVIKDVLMRFGTRPSAVPTEEFMWYFITKKINSFQTSDDYIHHRQDKIVTADAVANATRPSAIPGI